MNNVILSAILIGGLSAGIFEESARYLGARFILKNKRTYKDAISFGLGHGLCEVILLNGVANMNNTIYSILLNSSSFLYLIRQQQTYMSRFVLLSVLLHPEDKR